MSASMIPLDPAKAVTLGRRVKFLRLAKHATHKEPLSRKALGKLSGMAAETISRIEADEYTRPSALSAVAQAMRVPEKLFTCSMQKWMSVVRELRLEAHDPRGWGDTGSGE